MTSTIRFHIHVYSGELPVVSTFTIRAKLPVVNVRHCCLLACDLSGAYILPEWHTRKCCSIKELLGLYCLRHTSWWLKELDSIAKPTYPAQCTSRLGIQHHNSKYCLQHRRHSHMEDHTFRQLLQECQAYGLMYMCIKLLHLKMAKSKKKKGISIFIWQSWIEIPFIGLKYITEFY